MVEGDDRGKWYGLKIVFFAHISKDDIHCYIFLTFCLCYHASWFVGVVFFLKVAIFKIEAFPSFFSFSFLPLSYRNFYQKNY